MKKGIGVAVAIVVIILIALFANNRGGEDREVNQEDSQPKLVSMTDGQNTVIVSDQNSGKSVVVRLVELVNSGYVVIHEDAEGAPGGVIGVSELFIGSNENKTVNLERASVAGETLHAMLHTDDGDGVFTFPGPDVPLKDENDKVLTVGFQIRGQAPGAVEVPDAVNEEKMAEVPESGGTGAEAGAGLDIDEEVSLGSEAVVVFAGSGFSPSEVTIKKGGSVTFRNDGSAKVWPASAFHPTHTAYPGSGIGKCGTSEAQNIFDACRGLAQGETFAFTFNEIGSWNYHDHLNPSKTGRVNVE